MKKIFFCLMLFSTMLFFSSCESDPFRQSYGEYGQSESFTNIEINDDGIKRRAYFIVDESGGGSVATFRGEDGDYEITVDPFVADKRCQREQDGFFNFSTDMSLIDTEVRVCAWRE